MDHGKSAALNNTRLMRLLSDFNDLEIKNSQTHFAETFGQMLHFSNAFSLLRSLNDEYGKRFKPSGVSAGEIRDAFFDAQANLVRFIAAGVSPASRRIGDQLPSAQSLHAHCELTGVFSAKDKGTVKKPAAIYEPYRKFYKSRQNDIEIKVFHLRSKIREMIAGLSPELAQLAGIDQALSESLSDASLNIFAAIPNLLGNRFRQLFDNRQTKIPENPDVTDFEQWMAPGGWISAFCMEMRELLFAELELRLQPVVGMIDALPQRPPS